MSDIFKKIRSIEANDDAVTKALGLTPASSESRTPIRLSVPEEDHVLDMDDLSLGKEEDTEKIDIPLPDEGEKDKPKSRLGLKPILPVLASTKQQDPVKPQPVLSNNLPRPTASAVTVNPLPNFMDTQQDKTPTPDVIQSRVEALKSQDSVSSRLDSSLEGQNRNTYSEQNEYKSPKSRSIKIAGVTAAIVWLICVGLFLSGLLKANGAWALMTAIQKLGFVVIALFPLILIGLATAAFRHLFALSDASGHLKVAAEALLTPDDTVIARSTIMAKSIQSQVDEVNLKVSSALTRMELLDDMVKSQGSSLAKSAISIETTTNQIEDRLGAQREGLESIAGLFEGRMETLSHMMEGHTSQLASSGQMAEQRVQEARMSVESAAERIASASETVRQNAVAAAQTLSGSQIEITKLGEDVQAQSTRLDAVYRQHLADLKTMLSDLRGQQDELAATMEERLSKMRDMSLSAKVGAQSLTEASVKGRETVEALNEAASLTDTAVRARFSEMEEMVKYSTARAESISETAARQVQNSLSTTRKEIARIEADMMDLMDKLGSAEVAKATLTDTQNPVPDLRRSQYSKPSFPQASFDNENMTKPPLAAPESSLYKVREAAEETPPPPHMTATDLEFYDPAAEDLPAVLRRPSGENDAKDRGKWSLKGLFGSEEQGKTVHTPYAVNNSDVISSLTKLGLTPAAIVDDGCIIEASNLRMVKGGAAMSEAVARRLGEPVRHLFLAIETDEVLKSDISQFTAQFDARLSSIENDRESIRKQLESEAGRAYLLCNAALNA